MGDSPKKQGHESSVPLLFTTVARRRNQTQARGDLIHCPQARHIVAIDGCLADHCAFNRHVRGAAAWACHLAKIRRQPAIGNVQGIKVAGVVEHGIGGISGCVMPACRGNAPVRCPFRAGAGYGPSLTAPGGSAPRDAGLPCDTVHEHPIDIRTPCTAHVGLHPPE